MAVLRSQILDHAGFRSDEDGQFLARERHIDGIQRARASLVNGLNQLVDHRAGELLAEDLLICQNALGEITGEVSSDDLLGLIFGSFCIGK